MNRPQFFRLFFILPAAAGILLSSAVSCAKKQKAGREKSVRVVLSPLKKQLFQEKVPVKGTVFPVDYATISAKTEGTLDDLKVTEGVRVKKGDLLFSIDRATLENEVTVKREEVAVAKTELSTSQIELQLAKTREEKALSDKKRANTLVQSRAVSATDYETVIVNWKAASALVQKSEVAVQYRRAKLVQAQTNLKIAEKNLKDSMVTAPFDSLITEKIQYQGEYVKKGSNILKLEDISNLEVVAYMSAGYHLKIREGKTPVTIALDGKLYEKAVITYRAKTIDPVTRTFKIKVALPMTTVLSSGILCDLNIILDQADGWGVPENAVLQIGNRYVVYTATPDKKAKAVAVKRGIIDDGMCQIVDPGSLVKGQVVISGQRFLNDGVKLTIAE